MLAEEKRFIGEKIILFNPESIYPLQHPCSPWSCRNPIQQTRYVIYTQDSFGLAIEFLPDRIYNSLIDEVCFNAKYSAIKKTRRYKLEVDSWCFKYYDDADEVLQNIIRFISWAKKNQTKKIAKVTKNLIADFNPLPAWLEMKALSSGLIAKKRSDMTTFNQELSIEADCIEEAKSR